MAITKPFRRATSLLLAAATASALGLAQAPATADPSQATYTGTVSGDRTVYETGSGADSPFASLIDKDGSFRAQGSVANYPAPAAQREWDFLSGTTWDDATLDAATSTATDPNDPSDSNGDTLVRCDQHSPTGQTSTYNPTAPAKVGRNFCDLIGMWADPDTGDWYGLVHNEFTPGAFNGDNPLADNLHYDSIDVAKSSDQGKTWTFLGYGITSPYSTVREDTAQFPGDNYYYGDGDPRYLIDYRSGYIYVWYGTRLERKKGGWTRFEEHVARSPISSNGVPGSWVKYYNGTWSQPGIGGRESNLMPVDDSHPAGYSTGAQVYDPANTTPIDQQTAVDPTSPLFILNVTYDAYLGLYVGTPEDASPKSTLYVTDDLASQRWFPATGAVSPAPGSYYRWFVDNGNRTTGQVTGKTFRAYCRGGCPDPLVNDGIQNVATPDSVNWVPYTLTSDHLPAAPFDPTKGYRIGSGTGRVLSEAGGAPVSVPTSTTAPALWKFVPVGDGSYEVVNQASSKALGVDSTQTSQRAWGTTPALSPVAASGPTVGQEWWILDDQSAAGTYRLMNRYTSSVLAVSSRGTSGVELTPYRNWTDQTGSAVGARRSPAEQVLAMTTKTSTPEIVTASNPGAQTSVAGTVISPVKVTATDGLGLATTLTATGLPAGLSISSTGTITGTPTTPGVYNVTVTAATKTASSRSRFSWIINGAPVAGDQNIVLALTRQALTDPSTALSQPFYVGSSDAAVPNTQGLSSTARQTWNVAQRTDGTWQIRSTETTGQCLGRPATGISMEPCSPSDADQDWILESRPVGYVRILTPDATSALTAGGMDDGLPVSLTTPGRSTLQLWRLSRTPAARDGATTAG